VHKDELINICSELSDKVTLVKLYLYLSLEQKNVDYSLLIIKEINNIELLIRIIVDLAINFDRS
jgi:hypothetical protein